MTSRWEIVTDISYVVELEPQELVYNTFKAHDSDIFPGNIRWSIWNKMNYD